MVSEFSKQQRADRAARSQFKPGTFVALVNHHWNRRIERRAAVLKVHANGYFTICNWDGSPNTTQWKPDWDGTSARPAGKASGFSHSEHLEIWTDAHAAEIVETRAKADRYRRVEAVAKRLQEQRAHIDEHTLHAVEAALGLSTAAGNEAEAD